MTAEPVKPCPCGKVPENLVITGEYDGCKWAYVSGDCCGSWEIEFRTGYAKLDSDKCKQWARETWNAAPRPTAGWQSVPVEPSTIEELERLLEEDGTPCKILPDGSVVRLASAPALPAPDEDTNR